MAARPHTRTKRSPGEACSCTQRNERARPLDEQLSGLVGLGVLERERGTEAEALVLQVVA